MVQWLRLCTSAAGDTGLIPDWGSSTFRAVWGKIKIQGYLDRTWPGLLFALSRLYCFSSKNCLFSREHPVGGLFSAYLLTFQVPEVKTPERQAVRASRKIWQSRPETCTLDSISGSQCDSENILSSLRVFISVSVNGSGVALKFASPSPRSPVCSHKSSSGSYLRSLAGTCAPRPRSSDRSSAPRTPAARVAGTG